VMSTTADELREQVRRRYAESARAVSEGAGGCGCGSGECCAEAGDDGVSFVEAVYDAEQRGELPDARCWRRLAAATRPRSLTCTRGRSCSTSAPAAAST